MAQPMRRTATSEVPDFDVYPGTPEQQGFSPSEGLRPIAQPERTLPPPGGLTNTAERIGRSLGNAVNAVRDLPSGMRTRLTVVKGKGAEQASAAADQLKDISERAQQTAQEQWQRTRALAQEQLQRARVRAQYIAREYPLQVIAGAAAAGLLLGISLRVWRGNRG